MKKIVLFISLLALTLILCGCSEQHEIQQYNGTRHIDEWISPDGVHYWTYDNKCGNCSTYGMAPRYDREGNLVIDNNEVTEK